MFLNHSKKSFIIVFEISSASFIQRKSLLLQSYSLQLQNFNILCALFRYVQKRMSLAACYLIIQNLIKFYYELQLLLTIIISKFCSSQIFSLKFTILYLSKILYIRTFMHFISDMIMAKLNSFLLLFIFIYYFSSCHCWSSWLKLKFQKRF